MSHKNFVEDFSDLEIEREYITREELRRDPEFQKKSQGMKRSKVITAVVSLAICIVGGIGLLVFTQINASTAQALESAPAALEQAAHPCCSE